MGLKPRVYIKMQSEILSSEGLHCGLGIQRWLSWVTVNSPCSHGTQGRFLEWAGGEEIPALDREPLCCAVVPVRDQVRETPEN